MTSTRQLTARRCRLGVHVLLTSYTCCPRVTAQFTARRTPYLLGTYRCPARVDDACLRATVWRIHIRSRIGDRHFLFWWRRSLAAIFPWWFPFTPMSLRTGPVGVGWHVVAGGKQLHDGCYPSLDVMTCWTKLPKNEH